MMSGASKKQLSKNSVAALALAAGVALAAGQAPDRASAAGKTLTIENGTGDYADCLRSAFFEPFAKATGAKVLTTPENHNDSKFKLEVQTHHYVTDVHGSFESSLAQPPSGPEFFEPIDYTVIDKTGLIPELTQTYAVASDTYAYTLGYNPEKTNGRAPQGWADFFDLQKFPGKRGVGDSPAKIIMVALLADGVAPKDIVPFDYDRAFKKLDSIKSQLVYWETGSQSQDLLLSGETPLAVTFANRVATSRAENKPIAENWDGFLMGSDMMAIPKGDPNKATAMAYFAFVLSKDVNGRLSDCIALGPANADAKANPKWQDSYPTTHLDKAHVLLDSPQVSSWLASHADEINSKFKLWKSQ